MGTLADATIDTGRRTIFYRKFQIAECYDIKSGGRFWEWVHDDFGRPHSAYWDVAGDCQSLWGCIDAVNAWHEAHDAGQAEAKEG